MADPVPHSCCGPMAYTPRVSDTQHILHVLLACADPQHQQHKAALLELNQCRSVATFAPCAASVFAGADAASQASANIRELAGIELKNAMKVRARFCIDTEIFGADAALFNPLF